MKKGHIDVIVLLIAFLIIMFFLQADQYNKYNDFADKCIEKGGVITQVRKGFIKTKHGCWFEGNEVEE